MRRKKGAKKIAEFGKNRAFSGDKKDKIRINKNKMRQKRCS